MRLIYSRIAQFIAIAAIDSSCSFQERFAIKSGNYTIAYSDYVKSQVHLCIVQDLFGRSINEYAKALQYVQGDLTYRKEALNVLKYFYFDMAMCLVNNPYTINLELIVDVELGLEDKLFSVSEVKNGMENIIHTVEIGGNVEDAVKSYQFASIFDNIENFEVLCKRKMNFVFASILKFSFEEANEGRAFKLLVGD